MTSLLRTKLYVPRAVHALVPRPALTRRLEEACAAGRALTLVAAPAGSGKSTLVASWARDPAWLSLDEADGDPARFWAYVVEAIRSVAPAVDAGVLAFVESPQPEIGDFLVGLLNGLAALDRRLLLVLDDYHRVAEPAIHAQVQRFVERLPSGVHVVLITRADPPLALGRLRARGLLTEIREADLRFSEDEAGTFLREVMELPVDDAQVLGLTQRTEGWISGLQLAGLSMRGCDDPARFVSEFTGRHRYVMDYLVEEVLSQLREGDRRFLEGTAFLARLCGPLCDAVTGREDGARVLERLARANLFVAPLGPERRWFRIHHLLAELLVMRAPPGPLQHARAAAWLEGAGLVGEALPHARASGDASRLADLVERAALGHISAGRLATVRQWLDVLPADVVDARPGLGVARAWVQVIHGDVEGALASVTLAASRAGDHLRPHLELVRAYAAILLGQGEEAVRGAARALEGFADEPAFRSSASYALGTASRDSGDLDRALREARAMERVGRRAAQPWNTLSGQHDRAVVLMLQGRAREAVQLCRAALAEVEDLGGRAYSAAARLEVELAVLLRDLGDVEEALDHVARGVRDLEGNQTPSEWVFAYSTHAHVLFTLGRIDEGVAAMARAGEWFQAGAVFPMVACHFRALRTAVLFRMGRLDEAAAMIGEQPRGDGLLGAMDALALARLRRAQARPAEVPGLLLPRLEAAARWPYFGLPMNLHLALAREATGARAEALGHLDAALEIGVSTGLRQVVADLRQELEPLVRHGLHRGRWSGLAGDLAAGLVDLGPQGLVEPLTDRELEVLSLVAEGLSNKDIGAALYISVGTVKTHVHRIGAKLGARGRTESVARARRMGLLEG